MAKVFVSYSRKDIEFAKRLTTELQKSNLDFWIDWEGIPPTVDWWNEIQKGIEEADIFLFLISPDSAKSKVCGQEIDTAVKNGKRIIPIVVREIEWQDTPPQLGHLNYIFFSRDDDFDTAVKKLMTSIQTDYEWAATHRRLQVKALDWERKNKEFSLLLRGKDLQEAELQLVTNASKKPYPTQLQQDYILESRTIEDRQRRTAQRIRIAISVIGVVLLSMLYLAQSGLLNPFIYHPVDMKDYWITIPAGEFQMGSEDRDENEQPIHNVYLNTYQIGKYEVTNNQYNQCRRANVCTGSILTDKLDHPVTNVSWSDAKTYCDWVGGRLPTEAEWEKAASWDDKRKTKRPFPWGQGIDCTYANYMHGGNPSRATDDFCIGDSMPVGSYESGKSPYGLYDMAGNVGEWVNDWYSDTYYQSSPSSNPPGPDTGNFRILRGGFWNGDPSFALSTDRFSISPTLANNSWGFRCAHDTSP